MLDFLSSSGLQKGSNTEVVKGGAGVDDEEDVTEKRLCLFGKKITTYAMHFKAIDRLLEAAI